VEVDDFELGNPALRNPFGRLLEHPCDRGAGGAGDEQPRPAGLEDECGVNLLFADRSLGVPSRVVGAERKLTVNLPLQRPDDSGPTVRVADQPDRDLVRLGPAESEAVGGRKDRPVVAAIATMISAVRYGGDAADCSRLRKRRVDIGARRSGLRA